MSATLDREQRARRIQQAHEDTQKERQPASMASPTSAHIRPGAPDRMPVLVSAPHAGEVFSINFLRHQSLPLSVQRTLISLGVVYVLAQIGVAVILVTMSANYLREGQQVQRQIRSALPSGSALKSLKQAMQSTQAAALEELNQLQAYLTLQQERFPVGGKLAVLSKTLPTRTWITQIAGNRDRHTITVSASYLIDPNNPYALPTKEWIEALKQDASFNHGLKKLELGNTSRKSINRSELFLFELVAEWGS